GVNKLGSTWNRSTTCSSARIGLPAATRPMTGSSSRRPSLPPGLASRTLMPREEPAEISIAPFFSSARRCCSAAFTERKPIFSAISARVGGYPETSVSSRTRRRISLCLAVSSSMHWKYIQYWLGVKFADQGRIVVGRRVDPRMHGMGAHRLGGIGLQQPVGAGEPFPITRRRDDHGHPVVDRRHQ